VCLLINQVTLVGRLTKDPEIHYTLEGKSVLNIILALNRPYRNQFGEFITDFIQCTLWNKAAENTAKYCTKGSIVGIVGRLQTRYYENKEGRKVFITEVIADTIKFLNRRRIENSMLEEIEQDG